MKRWMAAGTAVLVMLVACSGEDEPDAACSRALDRQQNDVGARAVADVATAATTIEGVLEKQRTDALRPPSSGSYAGFRDDSAGCRATSTRLSTPAAFKGTDLLGSPGRVLAQKAPERSEDDQGSPYSSRDPELMSGTPGERLQE